MGEEVLVKQEFQNMEVMLLSWNHLVQENAPDQGHGHARGDTDHDQDQDQEIEVTGVEIGREEDPEVDLEVDTDPEAGTDQGIRVQIILN